MAFFVCTMPILCFKVRNAVTMSPAVTLSLSKGAERSLSWFDKLR